MSPKCNEFFFLKLKIHYWRQNGGEHEYNSGGKKVRGLNGATASSTTSCHVSHGSLHFAPRRRRPKRAVEGLQGRAFFAQLCGCGCRSDYRKFLEKCREGPHCEFAFVLECASGSYTCGNTFVYKATMGNKLEISRTVGSLSSRIFRIGNFHTTYALRAICCSCFLTYTETIVTRQRTKIRGQSDHVSIQL